MGARFLLIDGYNLLHAAGLALTRYRQGEMQRRRERLLREVAEKLTLAERARATVIFDARDPTVDRPHRTIYAGLRVIFARPEGDADVVITKWLEAHQAPRHVTLVSSDRELQRGARRVGAQFLESRDFLEELRRRKEPSATTAKSDDAKPVDGLTPEEAALWANYFGDLQSAGLEELSRETRRGWPEAKTPTQMPTVEQTEGAPETGISPSGTAAKPSKSQSPANAPGSGRVSAHGRRTPRGSASRSSPGDKPTVDSDLAFWLREFGDLSELWKLDDRPELALEELERWLREFEADSD
ncbi:MAG: NYN domain-containing protein [Planctomycetota bacterium]|nr:NYN domain-containing protein [Planctomycetota bacterium]